MAHYRYQREVVQSFDYRISELESSMVHGQYSVGLYASMPVTVTVNG